MNNGRCAPRDVCARVWSPGARAGWSLARALLFVCLVSTNAFAQVESTNTETRTTGTRVAGTVRDASGAAVEGAEVSLSDSDDSNSSRSSLKRNTDAAGRFDFGNLSATTISERRLRINADGFAPAERIINTRDNPTFDLDITIAPAGVSERVVVSATRTETRLAETSASVVVIDRERLAMTAAVTLDDALRQVPGFQLFRRTSSRTANPTAQGVSLRGTGASGASRALVLADGVSLLDPFGGWVYWGRVPRESIERVEVLRGAASDLYGGGALGGVIAIERRRADEDFDLSLETSVGSQGTPEGSLWLGGRRGRWGATLSAEAFRTDGYIIVAPDERGTIDTRADSRRTSGEVTLERFFGDEAEVANGARGANRLFLRAATYAEARDNGTPLQTNRTGLRDFAFGADGSTSFFDASSLRVYGGTQVYDQTFSAISLDRNSETLTRLQRVPSQVAGASGQASRTFADRHTIVAGFDLREVRGASDEMIFANNRAASIVGAGGRERAYGVFIGDISRVTDRLILSGNLRFDRWRNFRALNTTRPLTAALSFVTEFPERSESAFDPRASALLRVTDNVSLSASIARAFRQPTLNELYRLFRVGNVLTLANESLRAERATNFETGAILNFFDRRVSARTTFFVTDVTRPVANVTLAASPALITRQRQNLGRTGTRGFEAEAEARLTNDLTVSGGYLFADARVREFPAAIELEGLFLPQVARHQGTFQVTYANPKLLTVGLQGRALGRQFDDDQNRFPLRRFFALDALLSRRLAPNLEVFASAENLTDSRYDIGRTPVLTIAAPRFIRFGIRLRYNAE